MESTATVTQERERRRELGLRDLVLARVLGVVGGNWVGVAAGLGRAEALAWVVAMLLFYFPMAAVVIGLNRIMPSEGGTYVWARQANPVAYAVKIAGTVFVSNMIALLFYKLRKVSLSRFIRI